NCSMCEHGRHNETARAAFRVPLPHSQAGFYRKLTKPTKKNVWFGLWTLDFGLRYPRVDFGLWTLDFGLGYGAEGLDRPGQIQRHAHRSGSRSRHGSGLALFTPAR